MRKAARAHKGRRYAFGGIIIELCLRAGVPIEGFDYYPHIEASPYVVSNVQGPETFTRPILTVTERAHRDELIQAWMFGLEILRHRTGGHPSTTEELAEVEAQYPLNDHVHALLVLGPQFVELVEDDIPSDLDANKSDMEDNDEDEDDEMPALEDSAHTLYFTGSL